MALIIGAGWQLVHCTDREIRLRKDSLEHRMVLGHDGYVNLAAEPGMDRKTLIDKAVTMAKECDARVADMIARQHAPQTARYKQRQQELAPVFRTPEDPILIGVKRP